MLIKNKTLSSYVVHKDYINFSTGELLSPIKTQNYFLVQVADSYYVHGGKIKDHRQFCDVEITQVTHNKIRSATNGINCTVNKSDCYLSLNDDLHNISHDGNCRFQTLAFNVKTDSPQYALFLQLKEKFKNANKRIFKNTYIDTLILEILNNVYTDNPNCTFMIDACITHILLKLLDSDSNHKFDLISSKDLLPDLSIYIDKNFLSINSLEQLSDIFGYSYAYLCRIFKRQYGYGIQNYFLSKKMEYAKKKLLENATVNEISEQLNYSSPYNFSRAFKKHFGISPTDLKKLNTTITKENIR